MRPYHKHPLEDLTDNQLDDMMQYMFNFTEENREHIITKFEQARDVAKTKRPHKKIAAIALAGAMVFLVGFTNMDRIQQLYSKYFDGNASQISQYAEVIKKSSTDQGIRMDLLTAVNDGGDTYLFFDLVDETGDRLSENTRIAENWRLEGGKDLGGGNCELLEYDGKTKTAAFAAHSIGGRPGEEAVFTLNSFLSKKVFDIDAKEIDIFDLATKNQGQFKDYRESGGYGGSLSQEAAHKNFSLKDVDQVLEKDAIHLAIPGYDKGYISNIGYKDGLLHVQLNPDKEKGNEFSWLRLKNPQTGDIVDPYYYVLYEQDGLKYREYAFPIGELTKKNLDYIFNFVGFYFDTVVEGKWEVRFRVPTHMDTIQIASDEPILIDGKAVEIKKLTISPLSISFSLAEKAALSPLPPEEPARSIISGFFRGGLSDEADDGSDLNVTVVYKDGSKDVRAKFGGIGRQLGNYNGWQEARISGPIMNLEDIVGIEINGTLFRLKPVNGGNQ